MQKICSTAVGVWSMIAVMSGAQGIPPATAGEAGWERKWSAVTIAGNGAWGSATNRHKASARLAAIRACRARSSTAVEDCGERTATVLHGWSIAFMCGQRTFVVAEPTLEEAMIAARYREVEMRFAQSGGHGMPKCRPVVTVDPAGAVKHGAEM